MKTNLTRRVEFSSGELFQPIISTLRFDVTDYDLLKIIINLFHKIAGRNYDR
jgi:hypothetical protein